jgi:hypothetical protein
MNLVNALYVSYQAACREWMIAHPNCNGPDIQASGPAIFAEIVGPHLAVEGWINELRDEEGDAVTIVSDNADFNGLPNCAVDCVGEWTDWKERRFGGDTLTLALHAAVVARRAIRTSKCRSPLGCDCVSCVAKYGPIHPGNVGKELRSNPTGEVASPRKA